MMVRVVTLLWLVVVWVAVWESVSAANVLSGLAAGGLLLALFPLNRTSPRTGHLRPVATVRFLGYFFRKLVEANAVVAWEVVTPDNTSVNEGIVAVPINGSSDAVVALVANAISLTPGTLTLEVERDPTVLYVHVLHLRTVREAQLDVLRLERYALRAIGTDDAVADVEQRILELERTPTEEAP